MTNISSFLPLHPCFCCLTFTTGVPRLSPFMRLSYPRSPRQTSHLLWVVRRWIDGSNEGPLGNVIVDMDHYCRSNEQRQLHTPPVEGATEVRGSGRRREGCAMANKPPVRTVGPIQSILPERQARRPRSVPLSRMT